MSKVLVFHEGIWEYSRGLITCKNGLFECEMRHNFIHFYKCDVGIDQYFFENKRSKRCSLYATDNAVLLINERGLEGYTKIHFNVKNGACIDVQYNICEVLKILTQGDGIIKGNMCSEVLFIKTQGSSSVTGFYGGFKANLAALDNSRIEDVIISDKAVVERIEVEKNSCIEYYRTSYFK